MSCSVLRPHRARKSAKCRFTVLDLMPSCTAASRTEAGIVVRRWSGAEERPAGVAYRRLVLHEVAPADNSGTSSAGAPVRQAPGAR